MTPPTHEPGCTGPDDCGGAFVCESCGRCVGWCSGSNVDEGRCPDCWQRDDNSGTAAQEQR